MSDGNFVLNQTANVVATNPIDLGEVCSEFAGKLGFERWGMILFAGVCAGFIISDGVAGLMASKHMSVDERLAYQNNRAWLDVVKVGIGCMALVFIGLVFVRIGVLQ